MGGVQVVRQARGNIERLPGAIKGCVWQAAAEVLCQPCQAFDDAAVQRTERFYHLCRKAEHILGQERGDLPWIVGDVCPEGGDRVEKCLHLRDLLIR